MGGCFISHMLVRDVFRKRNSKKKTAFYLLVCLPFVCQVAYTYFCPSVRPIGMIDNLPHNESLT